MTSERGPTFRVVDKRFSAGGADEFRTRPIPSGYRPHSLLLGYFTEEQARDFLLDKGVHPEAMAELMPAWQRARKRVDELPALDPSAATVSLGDAEALAEIGRTMAAPQCKALFPDGTWTAELVEIAKLIAVSPGLDIQYAENLGGTDLDASQPKSAVPLCFATKHPSPFHVSLDQAQKSIGVSCIHPSFEVVGVRCSQQGDDGPLVVSFMVAPPPNLVVVLRHQGRHFLSNGYHRVYRLMLAGFSHVPCIVREAAYLADVAPPASRFFHAALLAAPRPPLMADFADPILGVIAPLRALRRVIRLRPDEYMVAT